MITQRFVSHIHASAWTSTKRMELLAHMMMRVFHNKEEVEDTWSQGLLPFVGDCRRPRILV